MVHGRLKKKKQKPDELIQGAAGWVLLIPGAPFQGSHTSVMLYGFNNMVVGNEVAVAQYVFIHVRKD